MEMTALEVMLGGALLSGVVGLATWIVTNSKYQTKDGCDERYGNSCKLVQEVKQQVDRDNGLMMRMLREVIMHLPIDSEAKADILNDRRSR